MRNSTFSALFLVFLLSGLAHAQVYRCVVGQQTSYQDYPCGSTNTAIVSPSPAAEAGLRDTEKHWIQQQDKNRPSHSSQRTPQGTEQPVQSTACWKKHQQLEAVNAQLKRGYLASQGEKLKRERARHQDYLKQFCGDL